MHLWLLLLLQKFSSYDIEVTSSRSFDGPFFYDPTGITSQFVHIVDETFMTSRGLLLHQFGF